MGDLYPPNKGGCLGELDPCYCLLPQTDFILSVRKSHISSPETTVAGWHCQHEEGCGTHGYSLDGMLPREGQNPHKVRQRAATPRLDVHLSVTL